MRHHHVPRRLAAGAIFLLQLALAGVAPLAHAWAEAARRDAPHVEAPGTGCAAVHDDLACAVCRVLRTDAGPALARAPAPRRRDVATAAHAVASSPARALPAGRPGPRAPPLA